MIDDDEMTNRWYTVLTVVILLLGVGGLINLMYDFSLWGVVGFGLGCVVAYWLLEGCARRGEPLARRILRRSH